MLMMLFWPFTIVDVSALTVFVPPGTPGDIGPPSTAENAPVTVPAKNVAPLSARCVVRPTNEGSQTVLKDIISFGFLGKEIR
jgi:hypothetical protein